MGIKIERGEAPAVVAKAYRRGVVDDCFEAAKALRSGEWFIVPDTAGKTEKQTTYVRNKLRKRLKDAKVVGVFVAQTSGNKGVLVKSASDGSPEPVRSGLAQPGSDRLKATPRRAG